MPANANARSRTPRAPLACDLRDACDRLRANAAHGWIPAFAMMRAWRGSKKTPSRVAIRQRSSVCCGDTRPKRRNVAARACSASRPRLGEFDADRSLASPDHVDFAETACGVDLQSEGVGHLDIFPPASLGRRRRKCRGSGSRPRAIRRRDRPRRECSGSCDLCCVDRCRRKNRRFRCPNSPPKFGFIPRARQCLRYDQPLQENSQR